MTMTPTPTLTITMTITLICVVAGASLHFASASAVRSCASGKRSAAGKRKAQLFINRTKKPDRRSITHMMHDARCRGEDETGALCFVSFCRDGARGGSSSGWW
ncbi:hypothetical protein K504DRAFT_452073 [Pleomassaria siparia CBS 279.74]|uniref:Secreted protein n=1 Tax=Pleomassaria siparia CBS 279.74 TaxID=1314801 RepID=A0A6G1JRI8_9PLEO|nr:hypothetical protein K504DRAFT_452073 [Pleomassaria siparia CBS 279.74]